MEKIPLTMNSFMHYGIHRGRQVAGLVDREAEYIKELIDAGELFDDQVLEKLAES